jgi:hypothetical protein
VLAWAVTSVLPSTSSFWTGVTSVPTGGIVPKFKDPAPSPVTVHLHCILHIPSVKYRYVIFPVILFNIEVYPYRTRSFE